LAIPEPQALDAMLTSASKPREGIIATIIGIGTLVFAAVFGVSFLVISLLFAMMFKWLPDAKVRWRDVWLGAAVTAILFELGKFLIGLYIGKQRLESTYGAAASIGVVLIWVYYSAQIVLFGAEFTNARAKQRDALQKAAATESFSS
jgi:membrane protein